MTLAVDIAHRRPDWAARLPDIDALSERAARVAWRHAWTEGNRSAELGIVLADDMTVRALNREYRGRDRPTNVLSFPIEEHDGPKTGEGPILLGDVVLAFETVMGEARQRALAPEAHVSHLIVHGVLHLMGYDHQKDDEAERMERLEIEVLAELGIGDPYRDEASEAAGA